MSHLSFIYVTYIWLDILLVLPVFVLLLSINKIKTVHNAKAYGTNRKKRKNDEKENKDKCEKCR